MKKVVVLAVGALVSLNALASQQQVYCVHETQALDKKGRSVCSSKEVYGSLHGGESAYVQVRNCLHTKVWAHYLLTNENYTAQVPLYGKAQDVTIIGKGLVAPEAEDTEQVLVFEKGGETFIKIGHQPAALCQKL